MTFLCPAKRRAGAQARGQSEGKGSWGQGGGDTQSESQQETDSHERSKRKGVCRGVGGVKGNPQGLVLPLGLAKRGAVSTPSQRAREETVTGTQKL